jgi:hypothetical protein
MAHPSFIQVFITCIVQLRRSYVTSSQVALHTFEEVVDETEQWLLREAALA